MGNMVSLQELDFSAFVQSLKCLEDLCKLKNLRKLSITWNSKNYPDTKSYVKQEKLVSSLCTLDKCKLHTLSIILDLTEHDKIFLENSFPALGSIREIDIRGGKLSWITRWLVSLVNLEGLYINDEAEVEQQDVEMIGSLPNLRRFLLLHGICYSDNMRDIVISGGFQQLQLLAFYPRGMALKFREGAMPNLDILLHQIHPLNFSSHSGGGFDIDIRHLSSVTQVQLRVYCHQVRVDDVKAAEAAFRSMAESHPNHPTFEITRYYADHMLKDDE
jgi:hypothetical protein